MKKLAWVLLACIASPAMAQNVVPGPAINPACNAQTGAYCTVWTPAQWTTAWQSVVSANGGYLTNGQLFGTTVNNGTISGGTVSANASASTVTATGSTTARTLSARAADIINPKDYGAIGDGNIHTVSATLGITTAAGLIAYTSNGTTPYAFVNTEPFGVRFNLQIASTASSGTTSLSFAGTGIIATQIASISAIASTNTTVTVADLAVTADGTAVASGTPVSASCLQGGTTVSGTPTGSLGSYTVTFTPAATGSCAGGTLLTFGVSPASGVYALPIKYTSGIRQGDLITGAACIPAGTQVDYVNPAKSEIRLSAATTATCAGNSTLTFIPSWLSNVTTGMSVRGLSGIFPSNETVSSVNTATGVVTLSAATTGTITPTTAVLGVGSPTVQTTQVTFWRPYTDAEVAALQMDRLGWQAAINAMPLVTGGHVVAPAGQYQIDAALIGPITQTYLSGTRPSYSYGGSSGTQVSSVTLSAMKDLGPNSALFSCGDPAGTLQNAFGIYQGLGYYCSGELHDIVLHGQIGLTSVVGERPKWSGTPVAMDGIKQGPRFDMSNVLVYGFNYGIRVAADHTHWNFVTSEQNMVGIYFDDSQTGLFGDEYMNNIYWMGNDFAGMMISTRAFLNVQMDKGYIGFNPYAIYCEPGPTGSTCITGSTFIDLNAESNDCGIIKDGSLADGILPALGSVEISSVKFDNAFFGIGVNGGGVPTDGTILAGGCAYNATFDLNKIIGLEIRGITSSTFTPVTGETAIVRVSLSDAHYAANNGGGLLEGEAGLWDTMQTFSAKGISMITGPGNWGEDGMFYTAGYLNWTLKGPAFVGHPMPLDYNVLSTYTLGTVLEYDFATAGSSFQGDIAVHPAGYTPNSPVAGTLCTTGASNPWASNFVPIICTGGLAIPVLTTATQQVGSLVKVGTTPGTAVAATGVNDTGNGAGPIGIISRSPNGTAGTMKALFLGAE